MPFDPTKPAFGSPDSSAEMRAQLNALNDKIDAVPAGPPGAAGSDGAPGAQGPPFASAAVDGVTTFPPGTPASVTTFFDGSNVRFTFGIPKGYDGINGSNGNDGPQGVPGVPGEVTHAELAADLAGTSNNSNGVVLLGMAIGDPPTASELQAVMDKLNELITALRR